MGQMTEGTDHTRELEREASAIRAERERVRTAEMDLDRRTRDLIARMPDDVTIRQIADLVGLSHQRVGQLLPGRRPRGRRPAERKS